MNVVYGDAETRGRLRVWKAGLAKKWKYLDRLFMSKQLDRDAQRFCMKGSVLGRQRVFDRIVRALAPTGAVLVGARLDGNYPIAVWFIIKPRGSVNVAPLAHPSQHQDCVTANYLMVFKCERGFNLAEGLWTLEIPDHAMGRLMHRSRDDPTAAVLDAHRAALRLRIDDLLEDGKLKDSTRFLLPAGKGAFIAGVTGGMDSDDLDAGYSAHIRCDTWIADDMMYDDQHKLIDDGAPGHRIGDSLLLPVPLRTVVVNKKASHMAIKRSVCEFPESVT
jgi:hypothetical protein